MSNNLPPTIRLSPVKMADNDVDMLDIDAYTVDSYFSGGSATSNNASKPALNKLFDKYRDDPQNEPDEIDVGGTMQLLEDFGVSAEDVSALIFSEMVKSPSLGKLTRTEFVDGLAAVG